MKKIALITGGNAGIGREAAVQLAKTGYHVMIGCRNLSRGKEALEYIKRKSQSEEVDLITVDMSLFSSICECSRSLHKQYKHIDVLIHNAAIFDISQKKAEFTSEGFETVWITNHIGPVYLTQLLMDMMNRSEDGRILTISSKGLLAMPRLKVDVDDPEFRNKKFSMTKAYYQSKLAQVMYTYWLAKELEPYHITVNAIQVPAVKVDLNRHPNITRMQKVLYQLKSKYAIEPEKMAKTYGYLATDPAVKGITGQYFDEQCHVIRSIKYSRDKENIKKVMAVTKTFLEKGEKVCKVLD